MKYILDENIRHILEERFILTEAVSKEDLVKILQYIKDKITELNNIDNTDKKETLDRLIDQTNKLSSNIAHINDAAIIKGHIDDYYNLTNSIIRSLGANEADIKNNFTKLRDLAASSNSSKSIINQIKSQLNELLTTLNRSLDNLGSITNKYKDDKGKDQKTTYTESNQKAILTVLYRNLLKLYKGGKEEDFTNPEVNSVITNLKDLIVADNLVKLVATAEKLNNNESKFAKYIANGENFKNIEHETENELKQNLDKNTNWDTAYKKATDKNIFWDEYYQKVWGPNALKIKALGAPFRQECERLGFTNDANPFLTFIERFYTLPVNPQDKSSDFKHEYPITPAHYTAIHDAVARSEFNLKEIINPASPVSENNMIIWCRDFYIKSSSDAKEYLNYFIEFKRKSYENIAQLDNSETYQNLVTNLGNNMESVLYNIFVNSKPVDKMLEANGKAETPKPIYTLKLRPLTDVKRLAGILNVTLQAPDATKAWETSNNAKLITTLRNNPQYKNDPATWAKWFIITIARRGGANPDKLADLASKFSWWKEQWNKISYNDEVNVILKELMNLGGKISSKELDKLIDALKAEKDANGKGWLE